MSLYSLIALRYNESGEGTKAAAVTDGPPAGDERIVQAAAPGRLSWTSGVTLTRASDGSGKDGEKT